MGWAVLCVVWCGAVVWGCAVRSWHFDPVKLAWNPLRNRGEAPSPRALHSAFSPARDLLLVLGGHDVQGVAASDLFAYDLRSGSWTKHKTKDVPKFCTRRCRCALPLAACAGAVQWEGAGATQ